jgi:hypothetical protein
MPNFVFRIWNLLYESNDKNKYFILSKLFCFVDKPLVNESKKAATEEELIDSNVIAIDLDKHHRLILALRTASATDMILNKETTESDDLLDALSLACKQITISR